MFDTTHNAKTFWHNNIVQWLVIGIVFLNIVVITALYFFIDKQDDYLIIFHYNSFFGVDAFESWWSVYTLPIMGAIFSVCNISLAYLFYSLRERIASYILLLAALLFHISIIIAAGAIILVNR